MCVCVNYIFVTDFSVIISPELLCSQKGRDFIIFLYVCIHGAVFLQTWRCASHVQKCVVLETDSVGNCAPVSTCNCFTDK